MANYYAKYRDRSAPREGKGKDGVLGAKNERERMAAALGVFSLDEYNIVGEDLGDAEAYFSNRVAFLNRS